MDYSSLADFFYRVGTKADAILMVIQDGFPNLLILQVYDFADQFQVEFKKIERFLRRMKEIYEVNFYCVIKN